MATWIVGDIHGWLDVFDRLLDRLALDPARDRLWLVGDLVNRGPDSLGVLRRVRQLEAAFGDRFGCVLGNHDLHLLAMADGLRPVSSGLRPVLEAPERDELLDWLCARPLALYLPGDTPALMVHAGLWPKWHVDDALERSQAVSGALRHPARRRRLLQIGKDYAAAKKAGNPLARKARDLFGFCSLRMLRPGGKPCDHSGPPEDGPKGCLPWFASPKRRSTGSRSGHVVVFGHWAALGLRMGKDWICLDSGCSWGRQLSAVCLDDRRVVQVDHPRPRSS